MDLEHLNKSQIILLTLLVSFVTSIATGIVTITLMEQAPPAIAQTVNRIIERTVEKVVPSGEIAGAATVTEKTIVVRESDLIAQAVESVSFSIVRLYTTAKDAEGNDAEIFLGFGLVLRDDGTIVTDTAVLPGGALILERSDGSRVSGSRISGDAETGLAVVQGATSTPEGPISWKPAKLASTKPVLGESVIAISGKSATRIGDGIMTALSGDASTTSLIIETNVPIGAIAFGSVLVNIDGEVEGISTVVSRSSSEQSFLASELILMYTSAKAEEANSAE